MPRSDTDSDDERYRKKKKKKSKSKDYERDRSRERSYDRDHDRDREKSKKHKKHKSEKKSKSEKSAPPDLTPAEKFNIFKRQREASRAEDGVVDDMFKDFIAAKLKEIEKDTSGAPNKDKYSKEAVASSVEEMKKFLDTELDSISMPVRQASKMDPVATGTLCNNATKSSHVSKDTLVNSVKEKVHHEVKIKSDIDTQQKDEGSSKTKECVIKELPKASVQYNIPEKMVIKTVIKTERQELPSQTAAAQPVLPNPPPSETAPLVGPMLPRSLAIKEEIKEEPNIKLEPKLPVKSDIKKGDGETKKPLFGFKNFGIKLSLTSTELIQSGAVHKNGKRLEDGEVLSSDSENSKSSNTEPEVEDDDDEDEEEISETGSLSDTDDESKSKKKKKKKKKGKHKKKKSKDKEKVKEEDVLVVGADKPGEKRKVSLGSRSRSRSPKKSKQSRSLSKDRSKGSDSKDRSKRSRSKDKSKRSRSKDRSKRSRSKDRSKRSGSKDQSKRSRSKDRSKRSTSREKSKRSHSKDRSKRSRSGSKSRKRRSVSKGRRSGSRSRRKSKDRSSKRERSRSKSRDRKRSRSRSPIKPFRSSRYGDFDAYRFSSRKPRSRSKTPDKESEKFKEKERKKLEDLRLKIDKAKLREIAIKNALNAAKSGGVQLDVTIKAGGKSVEELTEYCKKIQDAEKARKLARGENVSSEEELGPDPDSDDDLQMREPFKLREPSAIVMDIKNAKQLPIVSPQERLAQTGQLRLQFPVSSGSQHREKEWVPVEKPDPVAKSTAGLGTSQALVPLDKVFEEPAPSNVDISSIVSERLSAVRKLQENPNDIIAKEILSQAQHKASQWAQSKHLPGQFLGSTGANVMSQEELMGNKKKQAWIKKDVFTSAAPVTSGIGMFLLQKMGWKMGEGLGKNNEGTKEPLMLDFKIDRKGLVTTGEGKKAPPIPKVPKVPIAKDLSGKHPVSALGEFCNRRKWGAPRYELVHESGPSHKKDFVFKVRVNGYDYQPSIASNNKKLAKAAAATICLQELGMIPRELS